jgi:hypothetical protein
LLARKRELRIQKFVGHFANRFFPFPAIKRLCCLIPERNDLIPVAHEHAVVCEVQQLRLSAPRLLNPVNPSDKGGDRD